MRILILLITLSLSHAHEQKLTEPLLGLDKPKPSDPSAHLAMSSPLATLPGQGVGRWSMHGRIAQVEELGEEQVSHSSGVRDLIDGLRLYSDSCVEWVGGFL